MAAPVLGTFPVGTGALASSAVRAVPAVSVTAPTGSSASSPATVSWTYSHAGGKPQTGYRVRYVTLGGSVLFDTGVVAGAATSYASTYEFSSGTYEVWVTATDGVDTSLVATSQFTVDLVTIEDYPINELVGSVFEVGINGVGYMLADSPERQVRRQVGQVQAPRFATGETPFSEAVDRYTFVGQTDWSDGAGFEYRDRPRSGSNGFDSSQGVNVFGLSGGLELLPDVERQVATTGTTRAVVADEDLYVQTGAQEVKCIQWDGTTTTYAIGRDVVDMASDGYWVYLLTDDATNSVYRGARHASGFSSWTTGVIGNVRVEIEFAGDRVFTSDTDTSGSEPTSEIRAFAIASGAAAGGAWPETFANSEIHGITAGDGYVWFGVNFGADGAGTVGHQGTIRAQQLGTSDASFLALALPDGQVVSDLYFYLGTVMIGAVEEIRDSAGSIKYRRHLYRAVPSGGELTPELIFTSDVSDGAQSFDMVGQGRLVLFSWPEMADDGKSGVGAVDLSTGGYARWLVAGHASGTSEIVRSVCNWQGRAVFTVDGAGAYREDLSSVVSSGYVVSSTVDLASGQRKVMDEWRVGCAPLPANSSYTLEVSTNDGSSWTSVGSDETDGSTGVTFEVARESVGFKTRLTLAATGSSPFVRLSQQKLHPLTLVDEFLELPIDCSDKREGLNGAQLVGQVSPTVLMRRVAALAGTRVLLQDVDWPVTGVTEVWDVVAVDTTSVGVFDRSLGRRTESAPVAVVTLRRPA